MSTPPYDVLVVGAGPAGLSTALSATRHGARVLVVERHPGTSIHPRAIGVTTRSMEILRAWGLDAAVRAAGIDVETSQTATRTMADPVDTPSSIGYPSAAEALAVSPVRPATCPQDHLEPLLLAELRRLGTEVRFDTELTTLHTAPDSVRAGLAGDGTPVRARFVVGADGSRSTVRSALGIPAERLGTLGDWVQVLFRADLDRVTGGRRYFLYAIGHPDAAGVMLPVGDGRWAYARPHDHGAPDTTPARWTELIRTATGVPDLEPDIHSALPFTMAADVATTFRAGPGFLVGDAAHRMTPMGGVGMNTGIHDGHNLGWKLAWCARGLAAEALLDSYSAERRPVGLRNALSSLNRGGPDAPGGLAGDLGVTYRSDVISDDGAVAAPAFAPTGRPGERAPHRWIERNGRRVSTLDLFDGRLTLLTGRSGSVWRGAADVLGRAGRPGPPLTVLSLGREPLDARPRAYGISPTGAVLVRPDGYVAWRAAVAPADPVAALDDALGTSLGRPSAADALAG